MFPGSGMVLLFLFNDTTNERNDSGQHIYGRKQPECFSVSANSITHL